MRGTKRLSLGLGAVVILGIVLLAATPAQAQFPKGWSIGLIDAGFLGVVDCIDFRATQACKNEATCPANFLFAGKTCTYTNPPEEFGNQASRTTIVCNNINWGGFLPTQKVTMHVVCTREGDSFWRWTAGDFASASCSFETALRNWGGTPTDFNESLIGITIAGTRPNGRGTCADVFGGDKPIGLVSRGGNRIDLP
jgi:hypothetical protein